MKKVIVFIICLCFGAIYGQSPKKYIFNVELSSFTEAPQFEKSGNKIIYRGNNSKERDFFVNYNIINFYQTYPSSKVTKSLNMFTFETYNENLMNDLRTIFPGKYLQIEDLTNNTLELLYYPNDYGTTSPVTNLGGNISLKSFDYIDVPKAWDFFSPGTIGNVTVGISDSKIINTDADFSNKTTYIGSFPSYAFNCSSGTGRHGTTVAAIAAAQGNNGYGMTGVCPDCEILNVDFGSQYNGLLDLANAGAKVINMSWINSYTYDDLTYSDGYYPSQQAIINEIHDMGVVLVAGAGNISSYNASAPNYLIYVYPASYNHVISVSSVNYWNTNITDQITHHSYGDTSWHNIDHVSPTGLYDSTTGTYTRYHEGHTTNSRVDICAPGWTIPLYSNYLLNCSDNPAENVPAPYLGNGTSGAAPYVTGTVALMLSLNSCLNPDEIEDILQLTSKNIESNPNNDIFLGRIGSGKMETGDAVEFVAEAMDSNGNAIIDGQDFWRFNFDLQHIVGNLTISNQTLRDGNTSNFISKGGIKVASSHFKPGEYGYVQLSVDDSVVVCDTISSARQINPNNKDHKKPMITSLAKLYPNPATSVTTLSHSDGLKTVNVVSMDGKVMFSRELFGNETSFDINIDKYARGMYIVTIITRNGERYIEKLIKN